MKDIYSDPLYAEDSLKAETKMKLRLDSRGGLIKRALIGDSSSHQAFVDESISKMLTYKQKQKSRLLQNQQLKSLEPPISSKTFSTLNEQSPIRILTNNSSRNNH